MCFTFLHQGPCRRLFPAVYLFARGAALTTFPWCCGREPHNGRTLEPGCPRALRPAMNPAMSSRNGVPAPRLFLPPLLLAALLSVLLVLIDPVLTAPTVFFKIEWLHGELTTSHGRGLVGHCFPVKSPPTCDARYLSENHLQSPPYRWPARSTVVVALRSTEKAPGTCAQQRADSRLRLWQRV